MTKYPTKHLELRFLSHCLRSVILFETMSLSSLSKLTSMSHVKTSHQSATYPPLPIQKHFTPSVIYEWHGYLNSNKGKLVLRDSHTSNLIFYLKVTNWVYGQPEGYVEMKKVRRYEGDYQRMRKVEEVLLYAGGIKNGCKHGWGEETVVERYSDQSEKFRIVRGRWQENVLMESCRELQKEERRRMGKEDIYVDYKTIQEIERGEINYGEINYGEIKDRYIKENDTDEDKSPKEKCWLRSPSSGALKHSPRPKKYRHIRSDQMVVNTL